MSDFGFDLGGDRDRVLAETVRSKRFLAASRSHLTIDEIATWDVDLVRELRLLVPVDLQALCVEQGSTEPMVRLPMLLAAREPIDPDRAMPAPFTPGTPREPGVHLHWAMPDALLRGRFDDAASGGTNRLGLPPLPDRWVVLRVVLPVGSRTPHVRGWVLEADRAVVRPLEGWTESASNDVKPTGVELEPSQLTGTVGGSAAWAATYDAVENRFAFHDPLDDLDAVASKGVDRDAISYLVGGWWSEPARDPLDRARSATSLDELLVALRWRLLPEWGDARHLQEYNDSLDQLRGPLGLRQNSRFNRTRPTTTSSKFSPIDTDLTVERTNLGSSRWAADAMEFYETDPWHLRSSLLHGAVYGVPVKRMPGPDRRPDANRVRVAFGEHDGDVLAALSTVPGAPVGRRRDAERLLEAFASQRINRIGTPDGVVEIENEEHAAGFSSFPGGSSGTDRFLQRVEPGKAGGSTRGSGLGGQLGRDLEINDGFVDVFGTTAGVARPPSAAGSAGATSAASIDYAHDKFDLVATTYEAILQDQWDRIPITLPATQTRVVERPAPRFGFPSDPTVAVQGAGRSLRHANDGRASADGRLTCRWPTQVVTEQQGIVAGDELIPSIRNGAVPPELLSLARELVVHDPYHARWMAETVAPGLGLGSAVGVTMIHDRLVAEAAIRFGVDAVYDGSTQVFAGLDAERPRVPRGSAGRAGLAESDLAISGQHQARVSDQLLSFSLAKGADPDPVGVTAWSQPWIPLWLEWEAVFDPPREPSLEGWQLGAVDLEPAATHPRGETLPPMVGRSLLTTGAATTLRRAVEDWLAAEDQRNQGVLDAGEADGDTEAALARLARSTLRTDIVTATMDGFRTRLLGVPHVDGMVRRSVDGVTVPPAPTEAPRLLVSGRVRLEQARLVDAFGRTLDIPVDDVAVTVRDSIIDDSGALSYPPRLTRAARWGLRLVGAGTPRDADGTAARVDQVDPTLQVNPVAGFLLPDHLDESLEFFDTTGEPLGELLAEPVGGGVTWEIAPGRDGPPSAGPRFGLAPQQRALGSIAAGLVAADSAHRDGGPATGESALSALLRAIDTTLWTVDTFASFGSEHVAGLVGRPIAVVRAQLRLELSPPDDIDLTDPERREEWAAAERRLASVPFPVRIGELTRTDDGVLGFFVDDDYSRFRPVDKAVAALAAEGGRSRGQLGLLGLGPKMPGVDPITHPYVVGTDAGRVADSDTLTVHLGQTVTLTVLMHPAGRAFLTSGVLPRTSISLARDWVGPGLARISPSLRTGPLLVDTDTDADRQVRLPKVAVFGADQDFWWRESPAEWRHDAILSATQTALLPDTPAAVREGWIRVRPTTPGAEPAGGS